MKKFSLYAAVAAVAGLASVANAALADGGAKFLGNITTKGEVRSDMGTYWNQITAENGCKWGSIHSLDANGNSKFAWDNYDKCEGAYQWAKQKPGERFFKFHALVWGSQYPDFLCKNKNPGITVEKTKKYITEWFDAVAKKFPDLEYIDVVNEAIYSCGDDGCNYHSGYGKPAQGAEGVSTDDPKCGGSYIIDALGGDKVVNGKHQYDFITTAFKMARERWPKAVLIYNDYNTLSWQKKEGIELVQTIIKNGAPVDAYGQQAHEAGDFSPTRYGQTFGEVLTEIHNAVGIPLFITEYDVGGDDNTQKARFSEQIPFLWETEWIAGITIWGYLNNATWRSNTGILNEDGSPRAAMTWLKEYFASNLDKGQNTTGMGGAEPVDPEPQTPFKGEAFAIPGKIEAEDFDIPGKGRNADGTSNASYSDKDSEDHGAKSNGGKSYREGTGVDIYKKATGYVVGYNEVGDWLEYTVDVAEAGDYTFFAAVASANNTSSFQVSLDGKVLIEKVSIPQASSGEENYDDYNKVSANVSLTAGKHVLRLDVTGAWFDIDYFTFVKGKDATDPEPIVSSSNSSVSSSSVAENSSASTATSSSANAASSESVGSSASGEVVDNPGSSASGEGDDPTFVQKLQLQNNGLQHFNVFDMQGVNMGVISGYGFEAAAAMLKTSSRVKASGIYYLRNRTTGKMHTVRIAR